MDTDGIFKVPTIRFWIQTLIIISTYCKSVSPSWWTLGRTELSGAHADITMQCNNIPGLVRQQRFMCIKNPTMMLSVSRGARLGVNECHEQLKDRRWNCSTVDTGSNVFGKVTERVGSRESAFVYAISSAGVVHSIAKACSSGDITTCGCDPIKMGSFNDTEGEYSWQGCGSFISYSMRFAKRFIDAREGKSKDSRVLMNLHNNRVGRRTVQKCTKKLCKCHGVSGSCVVRSCWKSLKPFSEVGKLLKRRYDGAVQVTLRQPGALVSDKDFKPFTKSDLVYFEVSPDYCRVDKTIGTYGTAGRECDRKSLGPGGCDVLCCGFGYDVRRVTVVSKCKCKFHYCCYVTCEECKETKDIYVCKSGRSQLPGDTHYG